MATIASRITAGRTQTAEQFAAAPAVTLGLLAQAESKGQMTNNTVENIWTRVVAQKMTLDALLVTVEILVWGVN